MSRLVTSAAPDLYLQAKRKECELKISTGGAPSQKQLRFIAMLSILLRCLNFFSEKFQSRGFTNLAVASFVINEALSLCEGGSTVTWRSCLPIFRCALLILRLQAVAMWVCLSYLCPSEPKVLASGSCCQAILTSERDFAADKGHAHHY